MQPNKVDLKVVLIGDSGVGKSSIVLRFVADNFSEGGDATIGASYMGKMMQFQNRSIKFNIWDTAGQERFHNLAKMYYRDANAAIMVYDITNHESFNGLERWHSELTENGPANIIKIVAANKEDLVEKEAVSPDEVNNFAKKIGAVVCRTSAKTSAGVEQVFRSIATKMFPDSTSEVPKKRSDTLQLKKEEVKKSTDKKCC